MRMFVSRGRIWGAHSTYGFTAPDDRSPLSFSLHRSGLKEPLALVAEAPDGQIARRWAIRLEGSGIPCHIDSEELASGEGDFLPALLLVPERMLSEANRVLRGEWMEN